MNSNVARVTGVLTTNSIGIACKGSPIAPSGSVRHGISRGTVDGECMTETRPAEILLLYLQQQHEIQLDRISLFSSCTLYELHDYTLAWLPSHYKYTKENN